VASYEAFAKLSAPYVGDAATRHSWRGRWAGAAAGLVAVPLFVILLAVSGDHGAGATAAWIVWMAGLLCFIVMVVEFHLMSRAASRHLGVRFRFIRDSKYMTRGKFDAWLADKRTAASGGQ